VAFPPVGLPTIAAMTPTAVAIAMACAVAGLVVGWFARARARGQVGAIAEAVVERLPLGTLVVDGADNVVIANPVARQMGLVRDNRLDVSGLRTLAADVRHIGAAAEAEVSMLRGRFGGGPPSLIARASRIGPPGQVALLVEDVSESRRLEAVRRDFVANVSHELKTPIGALSLLAEAIGDASDSAEDVRRFAGRMRHESSRLAQLVQELIELSRLQGGEPLPASELVPVDTVVAEAVDATRLIAMTRLISVTTAGDRNVTVPGVKRQLVTAVGNLLDNAIRYSPERSEVAVVVRPRADMVDIEVRDHGIGIAAADLGRVFERFYRADAARSRATGGTGLGLAIVKHVATNHDGSVEVVSTEGRGSVFTLHIPALDAAAVRRMRRPAHQWLAGKP